MSHDFQSDEEKQRHHAVTVLLRVFDHQDMELGHASVKKALQEVGPNVVDHHNDTLLMHACINRQVDHVRFLLDQGARATGHGSEHRTALHYVFSDGDLGYDINPHGQVQLVDLLIKSGAQLEAQTIQELTPLAHAIERTMAQGWAGRTQWKATPLGIMRLIEHGARVDACLRTNRGSFPATDRVDDLILSAGRPFPVELIDLVRSQMSRENLLGHVRDTQALPARQTKF